MLKRLTDPSSKSLVVSFPKSGRTWLRVMLDELGIAADYTHAGSSDLEHRTFDRIHPPDALLRGRKVIFMYRDPRDTVISGYFQATKRMAHFKGSLSEFIRDRRYGIEKCICFNTMWLAAATQRDNICTLSYENLHHDTGAAMRRVLGFIGRRVPDMKMRAVIENGRFENMQRREASGELAKRYGKVVLAPRDPDDIDSYKVRRGKVGGWRDYLSPEDVAYCDDIIRLNLIFNS